MTSGLLCKDLRTWDFAFFRQPYMIEQLGILVEIYDQLVNIHQVIMQHGQQFVHVRAFDVRRQPFDVIT